MWPRTATARPNASTARPQNTKAAREAGEGNNKIAAIERKNPAGMTSSPAYFMDLPFQTINPREDQLVGPPALVRWKSTLRTQVRNSIGESVTEGNRLKCLYEF
jgi:hypothetical protein